MRVTVTHGIDDLERDLKRIATTARRDMAKVVREAARVGNTVARDNARRTAGAHGKHYPRSFSAEMLAPLVAVYGPDASKPQGGMSFEYGSRNQPPHLDLNKSADLIGPSFAQEVREAVDRWFW